MDKRSEKKAIWLDCDPGLDDTFALILAGYNPDVEFIGVSTSEGNTLLENTTKNACRILYAAGIENVPVVKGIAGPIIKDEIADDGLVAEAGEVHGKDGLSTKDGEALPTDIPLKPLDANAITTMYERIKNHPTKVHLVVTGSLTNVALLVTVFPDVMLNIEQVVYMGGAINFGNITAGAEANIRFDPEAAEIVMKKKGLKVVMVPLEVTHTALVTDEIMAKIKQMDTRFSRILYGMLLYYREAYRTLYDFPFSPLHDPCAIAYVIDSTIFTAKHIRVDVEVGGHSRGRTVCDLYNKTKKRANCHVTLKMDVPKFWEMMMESLEKANANSKIEKSI